jgi:hypothetical protein
MPVPERSHNDLAQELEDVRHALQWALSHITAIDDEPLDGEDGEDFAGATRLAWPDQPAQWA